MAVIKKEGKIIGEIVGAPLKEAPEAEAKSMAASAEKGDKIKLHKQETLQQKSGSVEVVTMRMELDGKFGKPWYFHSVYFPQKEASVTFKLITSENEFAELLPIFEKMLNIKRDEAKND